jgi:hypothetical protein
VVGGAGEKLPDADRGEQRRVHHLAPGEAQHSESLGLQVGVARTVAFEGRAVTVAGPPVGLDHQPVLGPEEVGPVATYAVVDERCGEAGVALLGPGARDATFSA